MLIEKNGDLLLIENGYIAHQCNCKTIYAAGLAKYIFERFPCANTYSRTNYERKPGTISIHGCGILQPRIVNMYAQIYPGCPSYNNDSSTKRLDFFKRCLDKMASLGIDNVYFPHRIGCGMAGGNWKDYLGLIKKFSKKVSVVCVIEKNKKDQSTLLF